MSLDDDVAALRQWTEPSAGRLARIRAGKAPRRSWGVWMVPAAVVAAGVAWAVWPAPPDVPQPDPVIASWSGEHAVAEFGAHVSVDAQGVGEGTATGNEVQLHWMSGQVTVAVEPDRGVSLQVATPEGVVEVVGTAFTVTRDPMGTTVEVARGTVRVTCGSGGPATLRAAQTLTCEPVTAVGWLRRVTALQRAGRLREVIRGVAAGLDLGPDPEVELELRLHRLAAWGASDRTDAARAERAQLVLDFPDAVGRIEAVD